LASFTEWKYWPDEEGAVTNESEGILNESFMWKYWPDEEGAVTFITIISSIQF